MQTQNRTTARRKCQDPCHRTFWRVVLMQVQRGISAKAGNACTPVAHLTVVRGGVQCQGMDMVRCYLRYKPSAFPERAGFVSNILLLLSSIIYSILFICISFKSSHTRGISPWVKSTGLNYRVVRCINRLHYTVFVHHVGAHEPPAATIWNGNMPKARTR